MKLTLGTRGSTLARVQSRLVAECLTRLGHDVVLREIRTTGDRLSELAQPIEGTGIFTRELDEALRRGEIDAAVHSLKDLPSQLEGDLAIAAIPKREDPRDALVARLGAPLAQLAPGARIGTGSPRRIGQILSGRPDLVCAPARGNVDTRLRKLRAGEWDAIVLAMAGLKRLGRESEATQIFEIPEMIPAAGQGALAIVTRNDDSLHLFAPLEDRDSRAATLSERRLLIDLEGGCRAPIAAHAFPKDSNLHLVAAVFSADGGTLIREEAAGDPGQPEELGRRVAQALLARGAAKIVAQAREATGDRA